VRVGTVDVPAKIERDRYFRELSHLELSLLFAGPVKPGAIAKWAEVAPKQTIALVAPFSLTHRKPPPGAKLWPHDATTGDFRTSATSQATLPPLREAMAVLGARAVVFRSPEDFSPSAANREQLQRFFGELDLGATQRVWLPGGLWEVRAALKLATPLGVTVAFDPLVREPGEPAEIYMELDAPTLYFRVEGSRTGPLRTAQLEDLDMLVEHYEDRSITIAFASAERWQDARNFKKLLSERT
jgi:uncharacterized protein YecE (DUF72 family)